MKDPEKRSRYDRLGSKWKDGQDFQAPPDRYEDLYRLHKILRLKQNCGVNTIGATIIVDLLEKNENLQNELERLRRK